MLHSVQSNYMPILPKEIIYMNSLAQFKAK